MIIDPLVGKTRIEAMHDVPYQRQFRVTGDRADDIETLNRYFSTKTIFGVELDCAGEAKQILQESLFDPSVHNAVTSLKALREQVETSEFRPKDFKDLKSSYDYGLEQYCAALGGTAANLVSLGPRCVKSALLCCQIFISIEQLRENYTAMAQHAAQGLRIMCHHHARAHLDADNRLLPASLEQLPLLDVFLIKLFLAPCRHTDVPGHAAHLNTSDLLALQNTIATSDRTLDHRRIAPDMGASLRRIALSLLDYLKEIPRVETSDEALNLRYEGLRLFQSLDAWLQALERDCSHARSTAELVTTNFERYHQQIMRMILMGTLNPPSRYDAQIAPEILQLQERARDVGAQVQAWRAN